MIGHLACSSRGKNAVKAESCEETGAPFSWNTNSNKDFHTCLTTNVPSLQHISIWVKLDTLYLGY